MTGSNLVELVKKNTSWDIISSAYLGMIAFCRIAHYVNTLILLSFLLAALPCEEVHIVLFLYLSLSFFFLKDVKLFLENINCEFMFVIYNVSKAFSHGLPSCGQ